MKRGMLMGIVILATTLPAFAGHGTIRETDEAIIVEYTGDADDKADVKPATIPSAAESSRQVEQDKKAEAERRDSEREQKMASDNKGVQLSPATTREARRAARNADIARRNEEQ